MEKVKIGFYCYLIADVLTKVLKNCSLVSPEITIWILWKPLNLIGCYGIRKTKFAREKKENRVLKR